MRQRAAQPLHAVARGPRMPAQRQHRFAGGAQVRQEEVADLAAAADDQHRHAGLTDCLAVARRARSRADGWAPACARASDRSEEHTSELQSLMRISYAVFCLKKKKQ